MTKESFKASVYKHRIDIIVIASLLLLSLIVLLIINLTKKDGAYVRVEVNGEIVGEYPLNVDNEYSLNGGTNTLTVKGGTAYMTEFTPTFVDNSRWTITTNCEEPEVAIQVCDYLFSKDGILLCNFGSRFPRVLFVLQMVFHLPLRFIDTVFVSPRF